MNPNVSPQPDKGVSAHDPALFVDFDLHPEVRDELRRKKKEDEKDWMDKKYTLSLLLASLRR